MPKLYKYMKASFISAFVDPLRPGFLGKK